MAAEEQRTAEGAISKKFDYEGAVPAAAPAVKSRTRKSAVGAAGCAAAGAQLMVKSACQAAAALPGYGRKWIGSSNNAGEAAGCVLWEDGNVEFNTFAPPKEAQLCNVRGTCLCTGTDGAELQVIGREL